MIILPSLLFCIYLGSFQLPFWRRLFCFTRSFISSLSASVQQDGESRNLINDYPNWKEDESEESSQEDSSPEQIDREKDTNTLNINLNQI